MLYSTREEMLKLNRYKNNPILKPDPRNWWEKTAVFNCATWHDGRLVHMLYRTVGEKKKYPPKLGYAISTYEEYTSRLGHATSTDGFNFLRTGKLPVFSAEKDYEKGACEDPRLTFIDGKLYMTYAVPFEPLRPFFQEWGEPFNTALALVRDRSFKSFKRLGIISHEGSANRDIVLFSEKINGRYAMLHRPFRWTKEWLREAKGEKEKTWLPCSANKLPEKPSIWIAYSSDLKEWNGYKIVMEPKEKWENWKIGAGPPPIKTSEGWLLIYHGVDSKEVPRTYRAGIALLAFKDPSRVIARLPYPILEPQEEYEKEGDTPDVVFPEGTIVKNGTLFVYYGGADKFCCLATVKIDDLLSELRKFRTV